MGKNVEGGCNQKWPLSVLGALPKHLSRIEEALCLREPLKRRVSFKLL